MSEYKFDNLSPFKFFLLETFPFIQQEYFDAMNEWQMFCKIGEKINEIINSQNSVGQETEALYNAFISLQDYINNYFDTLDVQDEVNNKLNDMAESGELAEIINQEIFEELNNKINSEAKISFLAPAPELQEDFGDCTVIQLKDKNIILDVGNETDCHTLINYLFNNNISKIDYVIISHYHHDHIGGNNAEGILTLITQAGLDFSECTFLLPHRNINYSLFKPSSDDNWVRTVENTIINMLTTNNIQYKYPEELEKIELNENSYLQFLNLLPIYYQEYYNTTVNAYNEEQESTEYNNFSMVTVFKFCNNFVLLPGDIQKEAEKNVYKNLTNCNLMKVEHHGLNFTSNENYLNQLNPKYAVVANRQYYSSSHDFLKDTVINIQSKNAKIYTTRGNGTITFILDSFNIISENETRSDIPLLNKTLAEGKALIPETDLNDIITPGTYFSNWYGITDTLLNLPKNLITNTNAFSAGFKLVVEKVASQSNRIKQTIYISNDVRSLIFIRTFFNDSWGEWRMIEPSTFTSINLPNENIISIENLNITEGYIVKRNGIAEINMTINVTQELNSYTDLIFIPDEIIKVFGAKDFAIFGSSNNFIQAYIRANNDGKSTIRTRQKLPIGEYRLNVVMISND